MATTALPLTYDLTVYRGTTFTRAFKWKPDGTSVQDFTGWSAVMWLRSPGFAAVTEYSTATNSLALNSSGQVIIALTSAQTTAMKAGLYEYSIELTSAAQTVIPFLVGRFTVRRGGRPG